MLVATSAARHLQLRPPEVDHDGCGDAERAQDPVLALGVHRQDEEEPREQECDEWSGWDCHARSVRTLYALATINPRAAAVAWSSRSRACASRTGSSPPFE